MLKEGAQWRAEIKTRGVLTPTFQGCPSRFWAMREKELSGLVTLQVKVNCNAWRARGKTG